jgi:predicted RecB family nuclease
MLKLSAQDIHRQYAPSECGLRVHLHGRRVAQSPPTEFEQVLMRLGQRYEATYLGTIPRAVDLRSLDFEKRFEKTIALVRDHCPALYQPVLGIQTIIDGVDCEIVGEPDFLIREGEGYIVRDVKMARHVDEKNHPEILLQLRLYGWLYEQVFASPPSRLEAFSGTGQLVVIPPDNEAVLAKLRELVRLKRLTQEPYEPVGWTKCNTGCGFRDYCWPKAEAAKDVALVYGVDQGLAVELHNRGVASIGQLLGEFDAERLSEVKRPSGTTMKRVGNGAGMILRRAQVMVSGHEVLLAPPTIPQSENYVMFDLEGMPPHLDDLDKIYLWGMQVFGTSQGEFIPALAEFGEGGDRQGWNEFLTKADAIMRQFGDIPFVHWHHYEKTHITKYMARYGDPQGIAARILANLLDLHPIALKCILLPLPSYSLKVVEKYVGFRRSQDEYGGSWSMAKYIEATETHDVQSRQRLLDQILLYNKEDLAATWAVFEWLRRKMTA